MLNMQEPKYGVKITKTKNNFVTSKEWNPVGWPIYVSDEFGDDRDGYGYCLITDGFERDESKAIQVVLTEDFLVEALSEIRQRFYKHLPDLGIGKEAIVEEEIPWPDHAELSVDEVEPYPTPDYQLYPQNNLNSAQDTQSVSDEERSYRCPTCGPTCCS